MKLIHTSDWLLGSRFHGYYRMEEQAHFLHWLRDLLVEREPDVLLISGDIFDGPVCSDAAETLFYRSVRRYGVYAQGGIVGRFADFSSR